MKYFKIVNPTGHQGMVYREGYNEDYLPFYPKGNCLSGGLYFASKDICAFLCYGSDVYEVEPIGEVYTNPGYPVKYKAHALNMKYIGKWSDINVIKYLVENGADIHAEDDYALRWAANEGCLDVVKYLVKECGVDIHTVNDWALQSAACNGHLEVVKYLVEIGANIHANNDEALRHAACNGYLEVVKYLVEKGADVRAYNNYALRNAACNRYLEVVKYLVEKGADVRSQYNYILKYSTGNGALKVVEYLKSQMDII